MSWEARPTVKQSTVQEPRFSGPARMIVDHSRFFGDRLELSFRAADRPHTAITAAHVSNAYIYYS